MKLIKTALFICCLFYLTSCFTVHDFGGLTYYKKSFDRSKIRLDGYYSCPLKVEGPEAYNVCAFYTDGTYFNYGIRRPKLEPMLEKTSRVRWDSYFAWGVFTISHDTLKVQTFYYEELPFVIHWTVAHSNWVIVNDSTLRKVDFDYLGKHEDFNKIYTFHQCDCKPDSMNYIKSSPRMKRIYEKRLAKR